MPSEQKFSKRPLYLQVRDLLAQRIAKGEWKPGSMLPSEDELSRQLGVSMGTMRKALDVLEDERQVLRRQGHGTNVVDQTSGPMMNRFDKVVDESGRPISGKIETLRQTTRKVEPNERERLRLGPGETVVRSERLWRERERPLMYEEALLALGRLPGLRAEDIGNYHLVTLAQGCGVHLASAHEEITLAIATPIAARHLAIAAGAPLLRLDRVVFAERNQPVEWRVALLHLPHDAAYAALMK
jgi:GntR family transcriptional regulator